MIWWTGLAPWEFESPFPGSLTSIFQAGLDKEKEMITVAAIYDAKNSVDSFMDLTCQVQIADFNLPSYKAYIYLPLRPQHAVVMVL